MQHARLPITLCTTWLATLMSANCQSYNFSTVAGATGQSATLDGTNNTALFKSPEGIALDGAGNIYVADGGYVRKITRAGSDWVVTTIPLYHTVASSLGVAADPAGNVFVTDPNRSVVWKLTTVGTNWTATIIAGTPFQQFWLDGTNSNALFDYPKGIALDSLGRLFVADEGNCAIRMITPIGTNWVTTTIAGNPDFPYSWDGTNRNAHFSYPRGVALDRDGNVYVADSSGSIIRRITPIGTNWVTTTIAGAYNQPGSADGTNRAARFSFPMNLTVDPSGNVFVADTISNTIRKITLIATNWVTTTIGGLAGSSGTTDGLGVNARFYNPIGIAFDSSGNLLVGDSLNYTIRIGVPVFSLQATPSPGQLVLSWSSAASNYVLETSASIGPDALWTPITSGISQNGDTLVFTTPPTDPAAFFRLHR
jgi:hypothetical protein